MKILSRPIDGPPLVRDFLADREPGLSFFRSGSPSRLESFEAKLGEVADHFSGEDRARLAGELKGGGAARAERLARFVDEGGFAVTTGQQPGLLAGPLYSLYKALTASVLARRLEGLLEHPVLPVFWVASQDHDWEEVRRTRLPDLSNELVTVELDLPEGMPPHPFHTPDLGDRLEAARDELLAHLPDSEFAPGFRELLDASHGRGGTLAAAEARLLEDLLAGAGVFILSPESPVLARTALPTLLAEARESAERSRALRCRGDELTEAGYEHQVTLLDEGVNLFLETDAGRERLFRGPDGDFRTRHSELRISLEELEATVAENPGLLTPNVLLRPVVESALVPTLAYVAGPGEAAYFPQTEPLFAATGRTPPIVHPRLSAVMVESKVAKVLDKFGLEIDRLKQPHHELADEIAREEIPSSVRAALGGLKGDIARGSRDLSDAVAEVDPTLKGTVDSLKRQGFGLLDDVEKKVAQALKRENEIALAQIDKIRLHLFPDGDPQERVLSPFYYLFRYGPDLLKQWEALADEVVRLPTPEVEPVPTGESAKGRATDAGEGG